MSRMRSIVGTSVIVRRWANNQVVDLPSSVASTEGLDVLVQVLRSFAGLVRLFAGLVRSFVVTEEL
jgi:hypothetical protein